VDHDFIRGGKRVSAKYSGELRRRELSPSDGRDSYPCLGKREKCRNPVTGNRRGTLGSTWREELGKEGAGIYVTSDCEKRSFFLFYLQSRNRGSSWAFVQWGEMEFQRHCLIRKKVFRVGGQGCL